MEFLDNLALILLSVLSLLIIYAIYRKIFPPADLMNFKNVNEDIKSMELKRQQINVLNSMLTDIDLTRAGEKTAVFRITWLNDDTGEPVDYDLYVYDRKSDQSVGMKYLIGIELERLRFDLQKDINKIEYRSRKGTLPLYPKEMVNYFTRSRK